MDEDPPRGSYLKILLVKDSEDVFFSRYGNKSSRLPISGLTYYPVTETTDGGGSDNGRGETWDPTSFPFIFLLRLF